MSKITQRIVAQAKTYVLSILDKELSKDYVFHNGDHFLDVYKNSLIIGNEIGLSLDELNCLGICAIFHDVGYVKEYEGHEQESVKIAKKFLSSYGVDNEYIDQVERAILATHVPQTPKDIISGALCDADLMNLTYPDYFDRITTMQLEWKLTGRSDLKEMEFHQQSVVFFNIHEYHTEYGREVLALEKQKNLVRIKKVLNA